MCDRGPHTGVHCVWPTHASAVYVASVCVCVCVCDGACRYESGRAAAVGALCRIFCAPPGRVPFLPVYRHRFGACVARAARGDPPRLVALVLGCERLVAAQLAGAGALVPDLLFALRRILPKVCGAPTPCLCLHVVVLEGTQYTHRDTHKHAHNLHS
jgi:hypothetical protein